MARVVHRSVAAVVAAVLLLSISSSVSADDGILLLIPVTGVHRGAEGTSVQVASFEVPAELVGQSCEIFGSTVNQYSVHPGNDLLIVNGDESFTIPDFEDEGDIVHDAGDVETLGRTIQLFVVFGPDGASSGGFRVTVRNCSEITTETTEPVVETTEPPAETTVPETTVPEEPEGEPAATPVPTEPAGPTTSEAPTTAPSTTEATTTTAAAPTSVAAEPPPAGPTATDTLPATGVESGLIAALGALLAAAGVGIRRFVARASVVR